MSDELNFFTSQYQAHRSSLSSASSTAFSANSPISPSLADTSDTNDTNTPPEYLFDYSSPLAVGAKSVPFLDYPRPRHQRLLPNGSPLQRQPVPPPNIAPPATNPDGTPVKRPRGRPRKHPVIAVSAIPKGQKGARSKTGCGTCRRRKKKCDETKPTCLNCQKNGVTCEGYRPVEAWKSGHTKSGKRIKTESPLTPTPSHAPNLPSILHGVETDEDRIILEHFQTNASRMFAPWSEQPWAFRDLFMPLAVRDQGVMHSLLALSGSHLMNCKPSAGIQERTLHHANVAIVRINKEHLATQHVCDANVEANQPLAATAILLCLKSAVTGEVSPNMDGYRIHWDAITHIAHSCPCKYRDSDFQTFVNEFASYHGVSQAVTSLRRNSIMAEVPSNFKLPSFVPPAAGTYFGLLDSLFMSISKITELRARIRARRMSNTHPVIDAQDFADASAMEVELNEWICNQQRESSPWTAGYLYRVCTWIYLTRTISPSQPSANLRRGVDEGLGYLAQLLPDPSTQGILLMPLFLLGCAAFDADQREQISAAFEMLRHSRGCENIGRAHAVVSHIWALMDQRRAENWDWEMVMSEMQWDFLVT